MINFLVWLIVGGIIGWVASMMMRTNAQQGMLLNIVVGIVGAFLGGFIVRTLGIAGTTINDNAFSLPALLVSLLGAVVLLGIVNLVQGRTVR
jgi:uncharacterized membrane protein YeaQ/YmgE (transglycosylase-associated protein family)